MGLFVSLKKLFCEGFIVLPLGYALLAGAVAGLAAVESKGAGVVFAGRNFDVRTNHKTS